MVTCPFKDKFQCSFLCQRYLIKSHTDSHVCEMAFNSKNYKKLTETDLSFEFNHEHDGFQFEWHQGKIQLKVLNPNLDFLTRSVSDLIQFSIWFVYQTHLSCLSIT